MKKHIKVRCKLLNKDEAELTFLEQSHFGTKFGDIRNSPRPSEGTHVFPYGKIRFASYNTSDRWLNGVNTREYRMAGFTGRLFFPSSNFQLGRTAKIPANRWPEIKEAIKAYNNHDFEDI